MKTFTQPLYELNDYEQMQIQIAKHQTPIHIDGCIDSQKSHLMSGLGESYPFKLIITDHELKAKELYEDYRFFDKKVFYYPPKDILFYHADVHSHLIASQRMEVWRRLIDHEPTTIITTMDGLLDRILPISVLKANVLRFQVGDLMPLDALQKQLINMGFSRVSQVESPGQFTIRGGILDIYNLSDDSPYRIELWGDEIDSIRSFDAESQRSIESCDQFCIYPASEVILTQSTIDRGFKLMRDAVKKQKEAFYQQSNAEAAKRLEQTIEEFKENLEFCGHQANIDSYIPFFFSETVSFLDYFSEQETLIFIDEPARTISSAEVVFKEYQASMTHRLEKGLVLPEQAKAIFSVDEILQTLLNHRTVLISTIGHPMAAMPVKQNFHLTVRSMHNYCADFQLLVKDLQEWKAKKYRLIIVCQSETRAKRLVHDLEEYQLIAFYSENRDRVLAPGEIMVIHGNLHRGMEYSMIRFAIIAESDIFGEQKKKRSRRRAFVSEGEKIKSFSDLSVGDYVVHENYGIGIYRGIETHEVEGIAKDYLKIEYGNQSCAYVLTTNLDPIQKYADKTAENVKIHKIGGKEWSKTKAKVKMAVDELATELVSLYAARREKDGFACGEDTIWQKEFEDAFPFIETQDQLDAIHATKRDMESHTIMDRLICGDVGFGKTEVAIRAAFKMVQEGRQCAILVPTTILAQQHYQTFCQRMKDYPVNISVLSRFRTKAEQKKTLEGLKNGMVDIVIGTHRLLSKDVQFKNLGLLVVDEEQRFGVNHKEKIKQMKETIDVLTLTATPIPRTMHMGLIGVRDMSILEEPPVDRLPIQTYVMEFNEEMVREAIVRELARGGQVYYVYNRVNDIDVLTNMIASLVPEAEVAFAHGQMSEKELENIMYQFINQEIDVLVATTIVETGLDIPNVNTMIIHDADQLGLSQLYQLRGRVGRSNRTAYAFLMYRRNKLLKEIAEKRLSAIREFTELGSGYRIAMKDLEIRGAGALLGKAQSGHMSTVGYDLYCKLLNAAVHEAKGEVVKEDFDTQIEINVDAFIPSTYIKNEFQKLDLYKRIACMTGDEGYGEILDEMIDRFGDMPKPAANLLMVALIKAKMHEAGVVKVNQNQHMLTVYLFERADINVAAIPDLLSYYGKRIQFNAAAQNPYFEVSMKGINKQNLLSEILDLANQMCRFLNHKEIQTLD